MARTLSRKQLVLMLLRDHPNGVTTAQFLKYGCGSRFGARVNELRGEGHEISCEVIRPGSYRYKLIGDQTIEADVTLNVFPGQTTIYGETAV